MTDRFPPTAKARSLDGCRCYVKKLPREFQFQLRWGAHALDCPIYRPSMDPVDNQQDIDARAVLSRTLGVPR